jgi:hypothetical protein
MRGIRIVYCLRLWCYSNTRDSRKETGHKDKERIHENSKHRQVEFTPTTKPTGRWSTCEADDVDIFAKWLLSRAPTPAPALATASAPAPAPAQASRP